MTLIWMRPSCGRRFSAIFMFAMIFTRLMMADCRRLGGLSTSLQHAVDAVPHAEFLRHRLQVDVRRAVAERLKNDQADQLDDRRVGFGRFAFRCQVFDAIDRHGDGALGDLMEHRFDSRAGVCIIVAERNLDFLGRSNHAFHVAFQDVAEAVERFDVERVAQGHGQRGIVLIHRNNLIAAGNFAGHQVKDFLRELQAGDARWSPCRTGRRAP